LENRDEPRIEAPKAAKSGGEESIRRLLALKTHGQEAFSYFPNSFLEGEFSEVRIHDPA
jgi:hypothetical protein